MTAHVQIGMHVVLDRMIHPAFGECIRFFFFHMSVGDVLFIDKALEDAGFYECFETETCAYFIKGREGRR